MEAGERPPTVLTMLVNGPGAFEIRIHGRGGQGVVTAAELLSVAAFEDGLHAQAFPSFGSERTGAPVVSFCRLARRPIRLREPVSAPDAVIVVDPTLLHQVDLFAGLRDDGYLLVNTARELSTLHLDEVLTRLAAERVRAVPATEIARRHLGRPLPNAVLLGAFSALTGAVSLGSVATAIRNRFPGALALSNIAAAEEAYATLRPPVAALGAPRA